MNGSMAGAMKVSGKTTICKDQGYTNGMMAECIKGSTKMIRKTGTEYIAGKIKDNIKATGSWESNMVLEYTVFHQKTESNLVFGSRVKELLNGSIRKYNNK